MSNFTPLVTKKFEFDGDTVTVRFARMKRKHFVKMMPFFMRFKEDATKIGSPEEGGEETEESMQAKLNLIDGVFDQLGDKMSEYVRTVEGLRDAAGNEVDVDTMLEDSYFLELQLELITAMLDESLGPMGKAKRS